MAEHSWAVAKRIVHERAAGCCEYCYTCESMIGQTMHVEHIDPQGGDMLENLCLSCPNCNLSKATAVTATDFVSGDVVPLFNPRTERWSAHFRWSQDFTQVEGITPIGRATVERLKMNRARIVIARGRWVKAGFHPPS